MAGNTGEQKGDAAEEQYFVSDAVSGCKNNIFAAVAFAESCLGIEKTVMSAVKRNHGCFLFVKYFYRFVSGIVWQPDTQCQPLLKANGNGLMFYRKGRR